MPKQNYTPLVEEIKRRHHIRIRKWRRGMTGAAWRVFYHDGREINWIESPVPKTPISLAIFLHEVGHHVIGFGTYRKRCEEEYHAWRWAIAQMRERGVEPDDRVQRRVWRSMQYAVGKAIRRGVKQIPEPLAQYIPSGIPRAQFVEIVVA